MLSGLHSSTVLQGGPSTGQDMASGGTCSSRPTDVQIPAELTGD
jgi:hypothetical protein